MRTRRLRSESYTYAYAYTYTYTYTQPNPNANSRFNSYSNCNRYTHGNVDPSSAHTQPDSNSARAVT